MKHLGCVVAYWSMAFILMFGLYFVDDAKIFDVDKA
jgi:hypothetical protein